MKLFKITSIFTLVLFLASCAGNMNIAKKRYSSGYNISLFNKQDKKAEAAGRLAKAQREVKKTNERIANVQSLQLNATASAELDVANTIAPQLNSKRDLTKTVQVREKTYASPKVTEAPVSQVEQKELKGIKKLVFKKAKRKLERKAKSSSKAGTNTLLLVIIALFIPPLAVFLHQGEINGVFWLNLIFTLLFFIPGLIHALIVVLGS